MSSSSVEVETRRIVWLGGEVSGGQGRHVERSATGWQNDTGRLCFITNRDVQAPRPEACECAPGGGFYTSIGRRRRAVKRVTGLDGEKYRNELACALAT